MSEIITKKTSSIDSQQDEHKVFETAEEQILAKPGMWIGSTKTQEKQLYLYDNEDGFVSKIVDFNPGVAKLIEEVIVNSADEHVRTKANPKLRGWVLNKINVSVDKSGKVIVQDNGGITTDKHSTGPYTLEVIFGKLFSSSNYDDSQERVTVGTNGVGASLANVFSKSFKAQTADNKNVLTIEWFDNKNSQNQPVLQKSKTHFTRIEYELELERFGLEEIPHGVIKYIEKLCMILAASYPGLEVTFNDDAYQFKSFKEYVQLYGDEILIGEKNKHWEIYLAPTYGEPARRFGIVNGAECNEGTHIRMINQIINEVLDQKCSSVKPKILNLTSKQLSDSYHAYINITVDKPEYNSQAKTELTTSVDWYDEVQKKKRWLPIDQKVKKQVVESDIFIYLQELAAQKENALNSKEFQNKAKDLNKKSAKTIKKLLDAGITKASERKNCELWLFEGESAGSGFRTNRYDPQYQGCYLLRGKSMNTADMGTLKVLDNQEISDIIVALGLDVRNPSDLSKLRYGKIIICTDMDYDGDSIIGQLITLFAVHFPELLKQGLIFRAISPLYRASKGKEMKYFFTNPEFQAWSNAAKGWKIDYFKGIGSLRKEDYKELLWNTKLQKFNFDEKTHYMIGTFMKKAPQHKKELKKILKDRTKIQVA